MPVRAGEVSYSGTVKAIDPAAGTLVLGEVGPWKVVGGATEITERAILLAASTEIALVKRATDGATAFSGDFVRTGLAPGDVAPGDFVTAKCVVQDGKLTALVLTVVRAER